MRIANVFLVGLITLPIIAMAISIFSKNEVIKAKSNVGVTDLDREEFFELVNALGKLYGTDKINSLKLVVDSDDNWSEEDGSNEGIEWLFDWDSNSHENSEMDDEEWNEDEDEYHTYSELVPYTEEDWPEFAEYFNEEENSENEFKPSHMDHDIKDFIEQLEEANKLRGHESKTNMLEIDDEALMREFEELTKEFEETLEHEHHENPHHHHGGHQVVDDWKEEFLSEQNDEDYEKLNRLLENAVKDFEEELLSEKKVHVVSEEQDSHKPNLNDEESIFGNILNYFTEPSESHHESKVHHPHDHHHPESPSSSDHGPKTESILEMIQHDIADVFKAYDKEDKPAFTEDVLELLEDGMELGQEINVYPSEKLDVQNVPLLVDLKLDDILSAYEEKDEKKIENGIAELIKLGEVLGEEIKVHKQTEFEVDEGDLAIQSALEQEMEELLKAYQGENDAEFAQEVLELVATEVELIQSTHQGAEAEENVPALVEVFQDQVQGLFKAYDDHNDQAFAHELSKVLKTEKELESESNVHSAVIDPSMSETLESEFEKLFLDFEDHDQKTFADDVLELLKAEEETNGQESIVHHPESEAQFHTIPEILGQEIEDFLKAYDQQKDQELAEEQLLNALKAEGETGQENRINGEHTEAIPDFKGLEDWFNNYDQEEEKSNVKAFADDILELLNAHEEDGEENRIHPHNGVSDVIESLEGEHPKLNDPTYLDDSAFYSAFPELSILLDKPSEPSVDAHHHEKPHQQHHQQHNHHLPEPLHAHHNVAEPENHQPPASISALVNQVAEQLATERLEEAKTHFGHASSSEIFQSLNDLSLDNLFDPPKPKVHSSNTDSHLDSWLDKIHEKLQNDESQAAKPTNLEVQQGDSHPSETNHVVSSPAEHKHHHHSKEHRGYPKMSKHLKSGFKRRPIRK